MNISKITDLQSILNNYSGVIKEELNFEFSNEKYLLISMIHRSIKNEYQDVLETDNEKLEFIGDSVLDLIVSNFLFFLPDYGDNEGKLTVSRSRIVNKKSLAKFSKMINIDKYLVTSKSGKKDKISDNDSVLSDGFEALIGAMFLDSGYKKTEEAILYRFKDEFINILKNDNKNYKSLLSEYLDKNSIDVAEYILEGSTGPDHNKIFKSTVVINNKKYGTGVGKTKKESESKAAKKALERLEKHNL